MDYKDINSYLSSLEIDENNDDNKHVNKKKNLTMLEREITLNSNPIQNIEIANPQRQFIVKEESDTNIMNTKISNYNFIQTKNYKQDLNVNFKKNN